MKFGTSRALKWSVFLSANIQIFSALFKHFSSFLVHCDQCFLQITAKWRVRQNLQVRKMLGFQIPNDSYLLSETVSDKKDRKFRRAARANTNKEDEKQHEQFLIFASRPKPAEGCFPHQLALKTWRAERADFFSCFLQKSVKNTFFEPWLDSIDWNRNQNTAPRCSGFNI